MGNPVDETRDRDAQPIGDEEPAHDDRAGEANAREGEPAEAAALDADDDEYEMVDPSELVDVPKEQALEADDALTTRPADVAPIEVAESSAPDVEAREPRRASTSLPPPPRTTISSAAFLTMSGTVPPIARPSKD